MEALSALRTFTPERRASKGSHAHEIRDPRSRQVLVVTSSEPLAVYQLDDEGHVTWAQGEKHPDGVVIGQLGRESYVCFVELKATMKPREGKQDRVERSFAQLESALRHFHPMQRGGGARTHGDEHHDRWREGEDRLPFMPAADHQVVAVAVSFRAVPRQLPDVRPLGRSRVIRAAVQVSPAIANRAEVSFRRLLELAGLRP